MKELQPWTGWSRNRKEVSQSLQPLQHATGQSRKTANQRLVHQSIVSTSLILLDTLTSLLKLSVPCVYQMELSVCSVQRAVLSHSLKTYGVRLTLTMYREWHSSTRWTFQVQISMVLQSRSKPVQERMQSVFSFQSEKKMNSRESSTYLR